MVTVRKQPSKGGVEDLNSALAVSRLWKRGPSQNRPLGVRRGFQRVVVERPTSTDTTVCSGVNSSRPLIGKDGGN
jgi:hypothetical protein